MILLVVKREEGERRPFAVRKQRCVCPWGEFLVLSVNRRIPWRRLRRAVRKKQYRVLLSDRIAPPRDFPDFREIPDEEIRFFAPLTALLERLPGSPAKRRLCLADADGRFLSRIEDFLPFAAQLWLVTEKSGSAAQTAKALLAEYGAVLTVRETLPQRAELLLDPEGWLFPWKNFTGTVFTAGQQPGGIFFQPRLPREFPAGFDPWILWQAFYRESGIGPEPIGYDLRMDGKILTEEAFFTRLGEEEPDLGSVHKRF